MEYKIKSRIWIEVDNNVLMGEGRLRLLQAIDKTGSLSKGAKTVGISYKKAWRLIDSINKTAKTSVVVTSTGGKNGGGTFLTSHGKALVRAFGTINKNCWKYLDKQLPNLETMEW